MNCAHVFYTLALLHVLKIPFLAHLAFAYRILGRLQNFLTYCNRGERKKSEPSE